jgi:hypothetical protein
MLNKSVISLALLQGVTENKRLSYRKFMDSAIFMLFSKHIQRRRHQSHETGDHSQTLILIDKAIVSGESIWNPQDFSIEVN